jgi:hypothetical protein
MTDTELIAAIRQRSARQNDNNLITPDFVLAALNECQLKIVKKIPRFVSLDRTDQTTYRIARWDGTNVAVTAAVRTSGGVVTITAAGHELEAGDIATVSEVSGTGTFNGNVEILSVDGNDVTYFQNYDADTADTFGTITKLFAKATLDLSTLNAAHIGEIWIIKGASTRQQGLKYRSLPDFRRKYIPVSSQAGTEPWDYTRQGETILFNCPISSDSKGLNFKIDYTAWAAELINDGTDSQLPDSDKGMILYGLAEVFDEIALSQPRFEQKALKTRALFNDWLEDYADYQLMLIEDLYSY